MEQSHSSEANSHSASQELPPMNPPLVPVLSHKNQFVPSQTIPLRSILILSFHLSTVLRNGYLPFRFSTKTSYIFLISPMRATWPYSFILRDLIYVLKRPAQSQLVQWSRYLDSCNFFFLTIRPSGLFRFRIWFLKLMNLFLDIW